MIVCRSIPELKQEITKYAAEGKSIGFVPTMGYLHEGHASLLRTAKSANDVAALSVFVNPLQFGPNEDLARYPRDEKRDLAIAAECGVDLVFMPSAQEMYPRRPLTSVIVSEVTDRLCGASRPGHFNGVGTVVSKLFHLVKPTRAYFGMKDAQQVAVIEQMAGDLNMDVEIVRCDTVREPDGLALSSRNVYLSPEQRMQAVVLSQSLTQAKEWIGDPGLTVGGLLDRIVTTIKSAEEAKIDYVDLLQYPSLEQLDPERSLHDIGETVIIAMAVKFGTTRLIDNSLYDLKRGEQ